MFFGRKYRNICASKFQKSDAIFWEFSEVNSTQSTQGVEGQQNITRYYEWGED